MSDRPLAEAERETPSGNERAGRAHARSPSRKGGRLRLPGRSAGCDRRPERVRGRAERVENRLVAHRAAAPPGEARGCREEHLADERRIERSGVAGPETGFDERGPVQRPRRAADRRHEAVSDGPNEIAGTGVGRQLREEFFDGAESGREVVAVVTVAEDGIETRQGGGMAVHCLAGATKPGPQVGGIDRRVARDRRRRGR